MANVWTGVEPERAFCLLWQNNDMPHHFDSTTAIWGSFETQEK